MSNLVDILCAHAHRNGAAPAYRFFTPGAPETPEELTFAGLLHKAASVAARLQERGLRGQRVLLVCEAHQSFVVGLYACFLAGTIAVPTAPPRRAALQGRLVLLARDAQCSDVLSDCGALLQESGLHLLDLRAWRDASDAAQWATRWQRASVAPDSVAFLQYTSGSTGDPKGVVITHRNLVSNCAAIGQAMGISSSSSVLTALPLYHDMGLIGGVLQSMYAGCVAHFMSPAELVQYPERWLQRIAAYRVTNSGGPNFMFDLAARDIDDADLDGIDLSSWRVAFCGAEPIRASTIAAFSQRFARHGFAGNAFYPCYGMAESTLFVTGNALGQAPTIFRDAGKALVGCGTPGRDIRIEVVDPETGRPAAPGAEGEIWIAGPSVARGYWNRPELSERVFNARLAGGDPTPFLRSGDLGLLKDGQLFVTGRCKDLIILYGKKYAPQDIEQAAGISHAALRPDGGAAFSVLTGDAERLVLVFELERAWVRRAAERDNILSAIRGAVSRQHGVHVDDIVLIRPGMLPRTSSGKVRRAQCQSDFLGGALTPAHAGAAAA